MINNTITSLYETVRSLVKDCIDESGRDSFEYRSSNLPCFTLCESYVDETTITVCLNGVELSSNDWSYDSTKNKVTISIVTSGIVLSDKDQILITYSFYNKFSDAIIRKAIQASFSHFVANRYKKTFAVSTSDKIIALDNTDPTTRELHFICIIASIILDPQNVNVRTNEFTISANRSESDTEQISKAFTKYQKFVGTIDNLTSNDYYDNIK